MTSQITSFTIVYSAVYSGADQRKHQSSASLAFVQPGNSPMTSEFHVQMASSVENVSIWWRHHEEVMDTALYEVYLTSAALNKFHTLL